MTIVEQSDKIEISFTCGHFGLEIIEQEDIYILWPSFNRVVCCVNKRLFWKIGSDYFGIVEAFDLSTSHILS